MLLNEANVRSIEYNYNDQELLNLVQTNSPDDFEGLSEWDSK